MLIDPGLRFTPPEGQEVVNSEWFSDLIDVGAQLGGEVTGLWFHFLFVDPGVTDDLWGTMSLRGYETVGGTEYPLVGGAKLAINMRHVVYRVPAIPGVRVRYLDVTFSAFANITARFHAFLAHHCDDHRIVGATQDGWGLADEP